MKNITNAIARTVTGVPRPVTSIVRDLSNLSQELRIAQQHHVNAETDALARAAAARAEHEHAARVADKIESLIA